MQGRSLRPLLRGEASSEGPGYFGEAAMGKGRALRTERYKYVSSPRRDELYDLEVDPGERKNLCRGNASACLKMRDELTRRTADFTTFAAKLALPQPEQATIDEATLEELRALGYAE